MTSIAARGRVDPGELERYRSLDCSVVLPRLAQHVKLDPTFVPIRDGHTQRWYVRAGDRDFEILSTGPKWFDTRSKRGGGGAIDLAMYLLRLDFKQAVGRLREAV